MSDRRYRLVIDPGHGGTDPGAINKLFWIKEKDVTLSVAKFLEKIVRKGDFLFETKLTRTKDAYTSLGCRCKLANLWGADAFVSIHCNARPLKGKHGVEMEVYHYKNSKRGREFANIALGILLRQVGEAHEVISRGVKTKNFYVLKHTAMPAILVELGFLTDDEEALFLKCKSSQKLMAGAIAESAELFFEGGEHEWVS